MNTKDLQQKHFDFLKDKYKTDSHKTSQFDGFLYLILRKAELGIHLTNLESQWLETNNFKQTAKIISLQQYQLEEKKRLESEFLLLKNKYRVPEELHIEISSPVCSILWKLDTGITITSSEIKLLKEHKLANTVNLIQDMATFAKLKVSYKATKYIGTHPIDPLYPILKKISATQQLSKSEENWLIENDLNEAWDIYQQQEKHRLSQVEFVELKSKYQIEASIEKSTDSKLYSILKKLDAEKELEDIEYRWLRQRNLEKLIEIDKEFKNKKLITKLQKTYKLSLDKILDSSSYLFFILLKLEFTRELKGIVKDQDVKLQISEKDIQYLEEQGLTETVKIAKTIYFRLLQLKYRILGVLKVEPFYEIMLKLEREERLDPKQVVQLIEEDMLAPDGQIAISHYRLEAIFYEKEYQRTGNKWNLASASSNWRKSNEPQQALKVTENVNWSKVNELALKSALLVTRGAAFRDVSQTDQAEICASQAMELQPNSHQPYTLMGAICYDRGNYVDGDKWFEMAQKRGAKDTDDEIRRIVRMTKDKDKRKEVAEYLLNKDSVRYGWAKSYID